MNRVGLGCRTMKIALVSPYPRPFALGLRYISSSLKAAGYDVEMLFMRSRRDTAQADFSPALLSDFARRLRDCDLIGMSVMTHSFRRACVLTRCVRDAGIEAPVVWGGVHPTLAHARRVPITTEACPDCGAGGHDSDADFCKFCGTHL